MQNTNRIQKNRSAARTSSQAKSISAQTGPEIKDGTFIGTQPFCLTLFDAKADEIISGMDISTEQLRAMRREMARSGLSMSGVLRAALDWIANGMPSPGQNGIVKKSKPGKARAPRNFFMVPVPADELEKLKQLCRARGTTVQNEARWTMLDIKQRLEGLTAGTNADGKGCGRANDSDFAGNAIIGLTVGDTRALQFFARSFKPSGNRTASGIAQFILRLALSRPAVVEAWLEALAGYCEAEDIPQQKYLAAAVASRREYRRVKVPGAT